MKKGTIQETIKENNSKRILRHLRSRPFSRAEIAQVTGLARSTVTTITKDLIAQGQIREVGTEKTPMGRSPILLDIAEDHRYMMGILFHRKQIAVCVVDLRMHCLDTRTLPIEQVTSAGQATQWAFDNGRDIFASHGIPWEKCAGIGINSPGPLNSLTGEILNPPGFDLFHHFNPAAYLAGLCGLSVYVSNAPVLMAVRESLERKSPENFLFIVVDHGVGAAVMQNGKIYRGVNGLAGELGHMSVDMNGPLCACGNHGCLEQYITQKALTTRFGIDSYTRAVDLAYEGDPDALVILDHIARHLSTAIVNTINLLDMDTVIIAGELNYRHQLLFSMLQSQVSQRVIRPDGYPLHIAPSDVARGDDLSYIVSIALQNYFDS